MKIKQLLVVGLFLITSSLFSQTNKKFIDTGSVNNQFDYLIHKSYEYKNYKSVNINWLYKLKSNVNDSLSTSKKEILSNYTIINTQRNTIDNLKTSLKISESNINNLTTEKQHISLFGFLFNKSMFKTILFLIIGVLVFLLVLFITKFKQSNLITKQTLLRLNETEEEFEVHRKVALEREQKVMRKLQDELNKQKKE
jgi:large-conductance mechanosensitive channel